VTCQKKKKKKIVVEGDVIQIVYVKSCGRNWNIYGQIVEDTQADRQIFHVLMGKVYCS
jgi:hypothetical protein